MSITLDQILSLVGKLDDSPGDETPRERFQVGGKVEKNYQMR